MRLRSWQCAGFAGVVLPVAGLLFWSVAPAISLSAALVGSGAALALLFLPQMSVLLWIGVSPVFGMGVLLFHALVRALVSVSASLPPLVSLFGMSLVLGAFVAWMLWRHGEGPDVLTRPSRADAVVLLALVPVLASTILVSAGNGYADRPAKATAESGHGAFLARGFVNGDTMTLFALVEGTKVRDQGRGLRRGALLRENPFSGNGSLEYPTLVHRSLADLMIATGGDITRAAWWLILPVLVGTVSVSVVLAQQVFRGQSLPLWSVVPLLLAFGFTWESFTYPQSHTFATGLFLLLVLLLTLRDQGGWWWSWRTRGSAAWVLSVLLLFSNAVLGTAAVALTTLAFSFSIYDHSRPRKGRLLPPLWAGVLLGLFVTFPPGEGAIGTVNVAYTAVPQFLVAALPALVTLLSLWDTAWLHRSATLLVAGVALPLLGFTTLVFSGRDIVAENSPRFLFLLVLLGWPAVVPLVQRVSDWWWRQVRHVEHSVAETIYLVGGAAIVLGVLLLPAGASVAGTLDVLVRKPPQYVSSDERSAFDWIRAHTSPDAVFLRAVESAFEDPSVSPLSLPAFTGRAQLRAEYWLSADDDVLAAVRAFFDGKGPLPRGASYLFCGPERSSCPAVGRLVYSSGPVAIRALE